MSAREQDALAAVLAAGFAVDRLRALGWAALNAAALPALVLWIDAWVRLPAPLVWLARATWPACAALAIVCAASESRFRRRYEAALPASRGLARVFFASAAHPPGSGVFVALAAALSSLIWLDAVAPGLIAPGPLALVRTAWAALVAATVVARVPGAFDIKKTSRARRRAFTLADAPRTVIFEERNHHGTGRARNRS